MSEVLQARRVKIWKICKMPLVTAWDLDSNLWVHGKVSGLKEKDSK